MKPFSGRNNSLELPGFTLSNSPLYVLEESRELRALVSWVGFRSTDIQNCNNKKLPPFFFFFFHFEPPLSAFLIVGGEGQRDPTNFFETHPIKTDTLHGASPHLKMKPPIWKTTYPHWNMKHPTMKWFLENAQ